MEATLDQEWKKGSAELLILSLLEDQPRHGYDIGKPYVNFLTRAGTKSRSGHYARIPSAPHSVTSR